MSSGSKEIVLIVEDAYGGEFFKRVLKRLNELGMLSRNVRLKRLSGRKNPIHVPYLCNSKLDRMILAASTSSPDTIIVVYDGDGPSTYHKRFNDAKSHIPKNIKTSVRVFLFEYEIEEWICRSLGITWDTKPSDELKRKIRYKKSLLPTYADKLDFDKLKRNCKSFRKFLEILEE
ncbi:hypothetical protein A3L09_00605 [Thermococcus profundus]|uniref:DUF4276 family protein n=1 Tax=Thermococcus profundus TaxID=49899 RepID=A0A2Z2M926_THEPR|nr:hypothetical protein [Thermococcus profundus]ASJ01863.1 hypothetical protein A3L09_00605 [Thermococcus profundus]